MNSLITPLQRQALLIGKRHHYSFRAVHDLTYRKGWVGEQVGEAPEIAQERIADLESGGLRVCEIYVFHEAPRVLPAPKDEPKPQPRQDFKNTNSPSISSDGLTVIAGAFVFFVGMMVRALFMSFTLIDPACVVRLEDGSLVEVIRWLHS